MSELQDKDPVHKAAEELMKIIDANTPALVEGEQFSLLVYQPDSSQPEYHAAIVTHLVVGTSPARAVDLLHRVLLGKLQHSATKTEKDGKQSG